MKTQQICFSLVVVLLWAGTVLAQDINEAATQGDLVQVKAWVVKDPGLVNLRDENGRTPLHWASRGIHLDILEYLVKNGANVNARDNDAVTPLHSLSYRGHAVQVWRQGRYQGRDRTDGRRYCRRPGP